MTNETADIIARDNFILSVIALAFLFTDWDDRLRGFLGRVWAHIASYLV